MFLSRQVCKELHVFFVTKKCVLDTLNRSSSLGNIVYNHRVVVFARTISMLAMYIAVTRKSSHVKSRRDTNDNGKRQKK